MISDFSVLARLQWKRFRSSAAYWLSLIGFEPNANRFYLIYVALFWGFWLFTVWVFVIEQVYQTSLTLPPATTARLQSSIPALVFLGQVIYLVMVLRDSPLKLGAAEIEHMAVSPVRRGALILIHFIRTLLLPTCLGGVAACLIAMLLTWRSAPATVGFTGLQALVLSVPVFLFSAACVWIVAVVKAALVSRAQRLALWLTLPIVLTLAVAFPQVMLFPGALLLTTIHTGLTVAILVSALALLALACCLLTMAGERVNMAAVADNSQMYARIQKLGIFARLYANDVLASVRRQSQLAQKRHLRLAMSMDAVGYAVILNRALLSLFRLSPSSILRLVTRGIALAGTVSLVIRFGGTQHLQTWVLLLMLMIQFRPTELNALFQQDVGQTFTRQFLPRNLLGIALADSIVPIALFSFGGLAALLVQPWLDPVIALVLVIAVTVGLELCQALELVTIRFLYRRIPYTYSVAFSGAVLIAAGYTLKSPSGVALAAATITLVLAALLYLSRL